MWASSRHPRIKLDSTPAPDRQSLKHRSWLPRQAADGHRQDELFGCRMHRARGYHATMCNATMDIALLEHPAGTVEWAPIPAGGAECNFLGRTRPESHPHHGELVALDYEAYRTMALRTMDELARTAASIWPCLGIRIHHALGAVPIGEASVFISVICPHRSDAFDACRWLIDTLKAQVPIWKQEQWADGTSWAPGRTPTATVET